MTKLLCGLQDFTFFLLFFNALVLMSQCGLAYERTDSPKLILLRRGDSAIRRGTFIFHGGSEAGAMEGRAPSP